MWVKLQIPLRKKNIWFSTKTSARVPAYNGDFHLIGVLALVELVSIPILSTAGFIAYFTETNCSAEIHAIIKLIHETIL